MEIVQVQVLCKENMKPSSPTPDHLRHYDLSFLDQISTPVFMPLVVFFSKDISGNDGRNLDRIRQSLSEALALFYPLAGRIKNNMYIDCNDEGALYVEARVKCDLARILKNPVPGLMNSFLPLELDDSSVNELPLAVQVNLFNCGGMALGLCVSHKVGDALSQVTFLNGWAAIARRDPNVMAPCFGSAELFPPVDMAGYPLYTGIVKDNIVTTRFVFDARTIEFLRERYHDPTCLGSQRRPTRAEALSTFLWSRYMASIQKNKDGGCSDNKKIYTLLHAVNLRPRMDPPLSGLHIGNISRVAIAMIDPNLINNEEYKIVHRVRDAIRQVDTEYVEKLSLGRHGHLRFLKDRGEKAVNGELVTLNFTSLCHFPVYDADFGWGKPAWVAYASLTFKNLIVFMDAKSGGGIEAWVNLGKEDMVKLEKDEELVAYVSPGVKVDV